MNLYGMSNFLTGVTGLFMALFVYIKGYRQRLARIWSFFAISAAVYGFSTYMVTNAKSASDALFWWQIAYIGIILLPFLFLVLVYEFLNIRHPFFLKFLGVLVGMFMIANFFFRELFLNQCTLYFSELGWAKPIYYIYPAGPLLKFFIIFFFLGLVVYAHIELIRNYKKITGLRRNQARYFFFAATMGFFGGGVSFLPCFGISFYPILNFAVPLYFLVLGYSILRHRLMDIRIVITRTGIFIVVYSLLLGLPIFAALRFKNLLMNFFGDNWWISPVALLSISATVGPFVYIYLQRKAENRLLKEQKHYHQILKQTGMEMTRIHNLQNLLDFIVNIIIKNAPISSAAIYLYDDNKGKFILMADSSRSGNRALFFDKDNLLISRISIRSELLVYEEIKQMAKDVSDHSLEQLGEEMKMLNAHVVIPGFLENRLSMILILGEKLSGRFYSTEDLEVFIILANQMAIGIENARLYENIEGQVKQRTQELVEVQRQLVQAEKLATMGTLAGGVAHEINNPLTAVLTNVQMLLTAREIDRNLDRESLELIEEATKRCRTIVQKLMTYAKRPLESAELSKINILEVITKAISFLEFQLGQENIKIILEAKDDQYLIYGEQIELEQVVTNVILNGRDAIRLSNTGSGEVQVLLSKNNEWVKMRIKDNGAGIPKETIPKIFDPFFTTKDVGKGLGLGLSICHSIVEKYKGLITVSSEVGKGTVFTIQFPIARVEHAFKK